ncbi:MAG TPA: AAA family ATPase [Gaiellaceae bacterium]|nr:AAA family ATPase [Gaiellaceae bacterium]
MAIGTHKLVGREEELSSLLALLDALPAVGVVSGEAGIGKTALWLAAVDEARARSFRVLSCRPSEAEARYSFSGLTDLLGGVLPEGLPAPQQRALETALALSEADRAVEERLVALAFLSAVRRLAAGGSVLIAIDDVQWLDPPSLALLRYAVARLEDEPVAVLLTARGQVPPWLARTDGLFGLELRPLSVGALHELLRTRLDAALPRPVLLRIWETSGGNPFFALELARALQRRGGRIEPGAELPVPETLEGLVTERLRTLTPDADEACRVVAAASEPTVGLVERVVGGTAGLENALAGRVLELDGERVRFTHPLLASAIAARTIGEQRRSLHERLAAHASDAEERARHLALAASGPSAAVAGALDEAAGRARARGSAAAAAELVEQALLLTPASDEEARRRRNLEVADLHFQAGDVSRSQAVLEDAADETAKGHERAAVLLRLGRVRAETSGAEEAVAVWRGALAEAEGHDELEARILFELGQFLRFTEGAEPALEHLRRAVEAAGRVGDDELACRVLGAHALIHLNSGRGVDRDGMERALELEAGLGGRALPATPFFVHQLVWTGDVERAREQLERWAGWARSRDRPDVGDASWYLGLLEWRHGSWEAAADAASSAVALTEQFGREAETITAWLEAVVAAHRGDLGRARAIAERGLGAAALPPVAEAGFQWVLGFMALSRDDAGGALRHLETAERVYAGLGILEPALRWHVSDLLDALLTAGEVDRAEELLVPFARRARELDRPWAVAISARTEALLSAGRGDADGAIASFGDALAAHERAMDRFQQARTLLALGATQRRSKQRRAARETLEQALAVFTDLPAPLWAAKARAELARIGGRAPSRGELTEAERRIAALAAEGRTNREIAAALFLTEHTVETALTRIYRKLDVRSRTALARRLSSKS